MDLLETGAGDAPLEDAIVLLCVHVQGLLVHGGIILDLIYGWLGLAGGLGKLVVLLGRCLREMVLLLAAKPGIMLETEVEAPAALGGLIIPNMPFSQ